VTEFVPDYQRVAEDIRQQIRDGRLRPGDKLPSRAELCTIYKVSQQTVASALLVLKTGGWTRGHQGRGVFVVEEPPA
jgi:DNA-binding GntR family transcriptional regulator